MIENLMAQSLLLNAGLISKEELIQVIDSDLIETPDSEILIDLEWCLSDVQKIISVIWQYVADHKVDYTIMGRVLLAKLKAEYSKKELDLYEFASKLNEIWSMLPESIQLIEPFWSMIYADEPLSWGDKKQTRKLYEKMFLFYDT